MDWGQKVAGLVAATADGLHTQLLQNPLQHVLGQLFKTWLAMAALLTLQLLLPQLVLQLRGLPLLALPLLLLLLLGLPLLALQLLAVLQWRCNS